METSNTSDDSIVNLLLYAVESKDRKNNERIQSSETCNHGDEITTTVSNEDQMTYVQSENLQKSHILVLDQSSVIKFDSDESAMQERNGRKKFVSRSSLSPAQLHLKMKLEGRTTEEAKNLTFQPKKVVQVEHKKGDSNISWTFDTIDYRNADSTVDRAPAPDPNLTNYVNHIKPLSSTSRLLTPTVASKQGEFHTTSTKSLTVDSISEQSRLLRPTVAYISSNYHLNHLDDSPITSKSISDTNTSPISEEVIRRLTTPTVAAMASRFSNVKKEDPTEDPRETGWIKPTKLMSDRSKDLSEVVGVGDGVRSGSRPSSPSPHLYENVPSRLYQETTASKAKIYHSNEKSPVRFSTPPFRVPASVDHNKNNPITGGNSNNGCGSGDRSASERSTPSRRQSTQTPKKSPHTMQSPEISTRYLSPTEASRRRVLTPKSASSATSNSPSLGDNATSPTATVCGVSPRLEKSTVSLAHNTREKYIKPADPFDIKLLVRQDSLNSHPASPGSRNVSHDDTQFKKGVGQVGSSSTTSPVLKHSYSGSGPSRLEKPTMVATHNVREKYVKPEDPLDIKGLGKNGLNSRSQSPVTRSVSSADNKHFISRKTLVSKGDNSLVTMTGEGAPSVVHDHQELLVTQEGEGEVYASESTLGESNAADQTSVGGDSSYLPRNQDSFEEAIVVQCSDTTALDPDEYVTY